MRAQRCQILFLLYPVISSNYIDRKRSLSGCTRTHMHTSILFTHSWAFGLFLLLAMENNDAVNMGVQVFAQVAASSSFEYRAGCGIARSYDILRLRF